MEKHFYITGTRKEIEFLALYSKVSTPKQWGKEQFVKGNIFKYEVEMRVPEDAKIENGKTYSFNNYLKRTDDLQLIKLMMEFNNLLAKYRCNEFKELVWI